MGKLIAIDQYNFHMEDNNLRFTKTWIWLIFRNLPNLTQTGLLTLLVATAFFHLQILKADNIPDLSTYYTSLLHTYIAENISKTRPANNTSAHCTNSPFIHKSRHQTIQLKSLICPFLRENVNLPKKI